MLSQDSVRRGGLHPGLLSFLPTGGDRAAGEIVIDDHGLLSEAVLRSVFEGCTAGVWMLQDIDLFRTLAPSGAKAPFFVGPFLARLKSCPFTKRLIGHSSDAACSPVDFAGFM